MIVIMAQRCGVRFRCHIRHFARFRCHNAVGFLLCSDSSVRGLAWLTSDSKWGVGGGGGGGGENTFSQKSGGGGAEAPSSPPLRGPVLLCPLFLTSVSLKEYQYKY